ncbi:hypothetical protein Pf1_01777 [Flavobacterium columnare]|nr:hypothetical protein Pf1_01777 [Flavobacterium columnare]
MEVPGSMPKIILSFAKFFVSSFKFQVQSFVTLLQCKKYSTKLNNS